MFKSDQHELTGVHWGLHIENISKGNTYMKDNHNKWMTDGIWLVFDIVYFEYFIVHCAQSQVSLVLDMVTKKWAPAGKRILSSSFRAMCVTSGTALANGS